MGSVYTRYDAGMRVGISLNSTYAVRDPREGARRMIERARAANTAGLDSLFVGDHHATPIPYYQNTAILGRCLAEWDDRPAGALYLLPLWHPVLLAEQVGTLASIARGPFILQCAIGPDDNQFPALGVDARKRPSRFEQSLAILRQLWSGEVVSSDGAWSFSEARVSPVPPEPVQVWIGAMADPAIERAARLGDGWLASPGLPPALAAAQLRRYREFCDSLDVAQGTAAIRRDVYVGADADEAARIGGSVIDAGYRSFPAGAALAGSIGAISEAFVELAEMGYSDVIVRNLVADQDHAIASIERLAEVRSRVQAA